jgi:hypothetical protein
MLSNWKTYSYIYTIVSRSFQTSHSESGLYNSIRLGYCLAYISTTFEMSISMSLWTYNKSRALKRSSPIVLRKEFFINRISSTLYSLTSINCVVTVRGVADCRNLTDGRTDIKCLSNGCKNLITLKDQTNKMCQSSREICLRKSGVRYA